MKKYCLWILFCLFANPALSIAQSKKTIASVSFASKVFSVPKAIWHVDKSMFSKSQLKYWGIFAGSISLAYQFDQKFDEELIVHKPLPETVAQFDKIGKQVNDFLWAGLLIPGVMFHKNELVRTGRNMIIAEVSANLVGALAWYGIGRKRPIHSDNNHSFDPFNNENLAVKIPPFDQLPSFPSMHAAGNFSIASVIAHQYGWKPAIPFYAFGSMVGFSRMAREGHYFSDIIAGAMLGHLAGKLTVGYFDNRDGIRNTNVLLIPSVNGLYLSVAL